MRPNRCEIAVQEQFNGKKAGISNFDDPITLEEQVQITHDNLGVWDADDEDDLIEEVTTASGWCIKSINYDIQLK